MQNILGTLLGTCDVLIKKPKFFPIGMEEK